MHARGGMRADYRPIDTPLGSAEDPIAIARALLDVAGPHALHRRPRCHRRRRQSFRALSRSRQRPSRNELWIDAGFSNVTDCAFWLPLGATLVIGSESLSLTRRLAGAAQRLQPGPPSVARLRRRGTARAFGALCGGSALARADYRHESSTALVPATVLTSNAWQASYKEPGRAASTPRAACATSATLKPSPMRARGRASRHGPAPRRHHPK